MSHCCNEDNCRRKQPMHIYLGDFSNQVFIATRSREVNRHADGTTTCAAIERHDITYQMLAFIARNPQWIREHLEKVLPLS